jgi:1-aminocyclopropane-1-carboxylate deaminase/D-cysteine desulfhydrase-like pyridoxal-dependent ACC family enzyme
MFIKRDDYLGPGLGGNKARKLEYLLADAQRRGIHKVVTFGGLQSNHARITVAAARRLGLEPHLFYFEKRPDNSQATCSSTSSWRLTCTSFLKEPATMAA